MNETQSPIFKALSKLDYAIGQLEKAIDEDQAAKKQQSDMFQQLQSEAANGKNNSSLNKEQIVKTLEKSIHTIETVLKEAS